MKIIRCFAIPPYMKNVLIALLAVWSVVATVLLLRPSDPPPAAAPVAPAGPVVQPARNDGAREADILTLEGEVARLRAENTAVTKELAEAKLQLARRAEQPPATSAVAKTRALAEATNLAQNIAAQIQKALAEQLGTGGGLGGLFGPTPEELEAKYGALVRKLGLTGTRKDEFLKALAGEAGVIRLGGLSGQAPENEALKGMLSDAEYAAWHDFEQALPYAEAVADFDQRLGGAGAGLTESQRDRLVEIFRKNNLAQHSHIEFSTSAGGTPGTALDKNYNQWDAVVRESGAVLNTQQQKALDLYLGERAEEHEKLAEMVKVQTLPGLAGGTGSVSAVGSVRVISADLSRSALLRTGEVRSMVIDLGETVAP